MKTGPGEERNFVPYNTIENKSSISTKAKHQKAPERKMDYWASFLFLDNKRTVPDKRTREISVAVMSLMTYSM